MITYMKGNFDFDFDPEEEVEISQEDRHAVEALRDECEGLEDLGLAAEQSGMFKYGGVTLRQWWDGRVYRYRPMLQCRYTGPASAWDYVVQEAERKEISPFEWAKLDPEGFKTFVVEHDFDDVDTEWKKSPAQAMWGRKEGY